jgi:ribosome-binding protein aMBF1 (putative translation factor)
MEKANVKCKPNREIEFRQVELDGMRYVIVRASLFEKLCRRAGIQLPSSFDREGPVSPGFDLDRDTLAEKLVRRRRASGLSQAELARRAGIRPETLNRIERGRTTPDFATVRKLVEAMNAVENQEQNGGTS